MRCTSSSVELCLTAQYKVFYENVEITGSTNCQSDIPGTYKKTTTFLLARPTYTKTTGSMHIYAFRTYAWLISDIFGSHLHLSRNIVTSDIAPTIGWEEWCGQGFSPSPLTYTIDAGFTCAYCVKGKYVKSYDDLKITGLSTCQPNIAGTYLKNNQFHNNRPVYTQIGGEYKIYYFTMNVWSISDRVGHYMYQGRNNVNDNVVPTAGWTEWCSSSGDTTSPLTYTVLKQDRCKNCDAGKYKDVIENTECTMCPAGKYQNSAGNSACSDCDSGYDSVPGSTKQDDCFGCKVGFYISASGQECLVCPVGTYKNLTGQSECLECPSNSNSPAASDEHVDCMCNAGSTGSDGGVCTMCDAGKYKSVIGGGPCDIVLILCLPGKYSLFPKGPHVEFDSNLTSGCHDCPSGTFNENSTFKGIEACKPCNRGTFNPFIGSLSANACEDCPVGKSHTSLGVSNSFICKECVC